MVVVVVVVVVGMPESLSAYRTGQDRDRTVAYSSLEQ